MAYVMTLFLKMLCVATFVPPSVHNSSVISDVTLFAIDGGVIFHWFDLVRILLCVLDFVAMCVLFSENIVRVFGSTDESKVLGVTLGWMTAENVLNRLLPLFLSSVTSIHSVEFDSDWLRGAIHANLSLYLYMALATSVLLFCQRRELVSGLFSLVIALLPVVSQVVTRLMVNVLSLVPSYHGKNLSLAIHGSLIAVFGLVVYGKFRRNVRVESSAKNK